MNNISLIVATKDRPDDLRKLLASLRLQSARPDEVVVVDASREPVESIVKDFPEVNAKYLRYWPPSAAAQRNAGIQVCDRAATLVGFADDDTTFEPEAFAKMREFWDAASSDILGAAFNLRNYPSRGRTYLKHSWLAGRLGLYSPQPGSVSPSGWQTVLGGVAETQFVDWLPSGATLFRRHVFHAGLFDEAFESYSYLEDLDLSYTISRKGRLAVVAPAGFYHFPSASGRVSARQFGRFEVKNRLYFVRKHGLSVCRCYLGLALRMAMSIGAMVSRHDATYLWRVIGNVEGLSMQLTG